MLLSNGLGRIGVFGRQVRQAVPFLCLASAAAAAPLFRRWGRAPAVAACGLVAVQAAWNFATPLAQVFPDRFALAAHARFGSLRPALSVIGPSPSRPAFAEALDEPQIEWDEAATRVLLNAQHLYPVQGAAPAPPGRVLARASHPLEYRPYQYEAYLPSERALLRRTDLSMRVVELTSLDHTAAPGTRPFPGLPTPRRDPVARDTPPPEDRPGPPGAGTTSGR